MPIGKSMDLPPEILQFAGSLVAILVLAGIAYALRLGGEPPLADATAAQRAASEAVDGYHAIAMAIDRGGRGAIMRDSAGRILLLKPHGNKFAGRILDARASAQAGNAILTVSSGERRYGKITLAIDDPHTWADAVNGLRERQDA